MAQTTRGVFENVSKIYTAFFSIKGARKIAEVYIETNEKLAKESLDYSRKFVNYRPAARASSGKLPKSTGARHATADRVSVASRDRDRNCGIEFALDKSEQRSRTTECFAHSAGRSAADCVQTWPSPSGAITSTPASGSRRRLTVSPTESRRSAERAGLGQAPRAGLIGILSDRASRRDTG